MNMNQNAWAFLASEYHDGKVKAHNLLTPYEGAMRFDADNVAVLVIRTHHEAQYQEKSGGGTALPVRDNLDQPTAETVFYEFREWEERDAHDQFDFGAYDEDEVDAAFDDFTSDAYNDACGRAEEVDYLEAFLIAFDPGNDVGQYGECDLGGVSWLDVAGAYNPEFLTWNEVVHRAIETIESATLRYSKNEHDDRWVVGLDQGDTK